MTREKIEGAKEVVVPYIVEELRHYNIDGNGEADAEEARKDLEEIFGLAIKALEQEPKTGHWIEKGKTDIAYDMSGYKSWATKYMCNHCGFIHTAIENHGVYSYCPNCGAKMVEPQESEG